MVMIFVEIVISVPHTGAEGYAINHCNYHSSQVEAFMIVPSLG